MNVGTSKAVILQRVADKLDEIDRNGCSFGKVLREKVQGNEDDIVEIKKDTLVEIKNSLKRTNRQMFLTLISVVITFATLLIRALI